MPQQEFEARILDTLNEIDSALGTQPREDVFRDVLVRFARTLSRHRAIGAAIADVPELPGGLRLLTWPKLRRDQRAMMLHFASQAGTLILLGEERRELRSPEELEAYLAREFLRTPSFMATLAHYEQTGATPVRGYLRRGKPGEVSPADVAVTLTPDEQRKLAEAEPGTDVSVFASEDRMPLSSLFVSGASYASLLAGGYGMWVMFPSRAEDGRIRVAGTAMREDELS